VATSASARPPCRRQAAAGNPPSSLVWSMRKTLPRSASYGGTEWAPRSAN